MKATVEINFENWKGEEPLDFLVELNNWLKDQGLDYFLVESRTDLGSRLRFSSGMKSATSNKVEAGVG